MTVARALVSRGRLPLLLVALFALGVLWGCKGVSDAPTYPDPPVVLPPNYFYAVWGTGADDVYVVGQPGLIYHWNGSAWAREDSHTTEVLTDVWGDGSGTVYVTGNNGTILRKSGGGWSRMNSGTSKNLFAVGQYHGTVVAAGRNGAVQRLSGGNWTTSPSVIFVRDPNGAVTDTLDLSKDIESLTTVFEYGIGGSDGIVLMQDQDADYLLRRVKGGEGWVAASFGSADISANFIVTDFGRLFQMVELESGALSWKERFSPAEIGERIYGIWVDDQNTVFVCTERGRVNRVRPSEPDGAFQQLYGDGASLYDIWGTSALDLYAVGIDARILHYNDPGDGGGQRWVAESVPDLPGDKTVAQDGRDKFGRRF